MKHIAIYNDWIRHHATYRAHHQALVDDAKAVTRTYAELDRRVDALAFSLQVQYGVQRGDRVLLLSKSCTCLLYTSPSPRD